MAYTTINKSGDYFNTKLYTGNGGTQSITGVGHQPDFTWIKQRDNGAYSHMAFDAVRGVGKSIIPDTNAAEGNQTNGITAFGTDGFSIGDFSAGNYSGRNYVAWNWKAGGGQGSSNTDGTINTTYTSANTTAGFSISKYTGTGANATFGHGLGVKPDIVFWKRTDNNAGTVNWIVQSPLLGNQNKLVLNTTEATSTGSSFSQTNNWTNSLIDLKTYEGENSSGGTYIAYAFASKTGYSKFGSYTGNGNNDGVFVYTGFKPAFVIIKSTSTNTWIMLDNKRGSYNVNQSKLFADANSAENTDTSNGIDFLSNGLKLRRNNSEINTSGQSYIYMVFGAAPLVGSNNVPCTAR
jgi:hypothetical protein